MEPALHCGAPSHVGLRAEAVSQARHDGAMRRTTPEVGCQKHPHLHRRKTRVTEGGNEPIRSTEGQNKSGNIQSRQVQTANATGFPLEVENV